MEAWEGLGLLRSSAQPSPAGPRGDRRWDASRTRSSRPTPSALRALPGIGAYTAGAVSSFAYERRAALVDTNVARVLKRAFAPSANVKTHEGAADRLGVGRVASAAHGPRDVDAQPGADGARGAGLHGARGALRAVPRPGPLPDRGETTERRAP